MVYVTEMMAEVCDKFGATLTEFTGETDHVHLSIHHPPTVQLSTLVNSLEGASARYLRQEFPDHTQKYLLGQSLLVTVLLRRLRQRSPTRHRRRVHHQPKTTQTHARKRPRYAPSRGKESASSQPDWARLPLINPMNSPLTDSGPAPRCAPYVPCAAGTSLLASCPRRVV
ncbi:hypothetical protein CA951_29220 [Rhodococcus sp. NCIMB 12038]|nr:hypothetical protein CA951_29220 [Rhodococcus sp. NCIMB 12038]